MTDLWNAACCWLNCFPSWDTSIAKVAIRSVNWVAYHEAGHVATAIKFGEFISEVTILSPPGEPPYGLSQSSGGSQVAVGGHAVELALYDRNRLVDEHNRPLSMESFFAEAQHTTSKDRELFAKHQHEAPSGLSGTFDENARRVAQMIDLDLVERLARTLIARRKLDPFDLKRLHQKR